MPLKSLVRLQYFTFSKLVRVCYTIETNPANGQGSVVRFDRKPPLKDGDLLYLTLEDGLVLQCHMLDESPYCAVVEDGPMIERRANAGT